MTNLTYAEITRKEAPSIYTHQELYAHITKFIKNEKLYTFTYTGEFDLPDNTRYYKVEIDNQLLFKNLRTGTISTIKRTRDASKQPF